MVTTLAIIFVLFLIGTVFYGFGIVMRRPPTEEELSTEKCSLCGGRYPKENLIERQVGDYRLLYFCKSCIDGLYEELRENNVQDEMDSRKLLSDVEGNKN